MSQSQVHSVAAYPVHSVHNQRLQNYSQSNSVRSQKSVVDGPDIKVVETESTPKANFFTCKFGIDKNQITCAQSPSQLSSLFFKLYYSSSVPLIASVYYFCEESLAPLEGHTVDLKPRLGPFSGSHFKLDAGMHKPFGWVLREEGLIQKVKELKDEREAHLYSVVVRLEEEAKLGTCQSLLFTYVDITLGEASSEGALPPVECFVIRQKREVFGQVYDLIDVFGLEEKGGENAPENENLCLICLCEEPDCILLPCRHMVVDIGCAKSIDDKSRKVECPLCRTAVEEIIYLGKKPSNEAQNPDLATEEKKEGKKENQASTTQLQSNFSLPAHEPMPTINFRESAFRVNSQTGQQTNAENLPTAQALANPSMEISTMNPSPDRQPVPPTRQFRSQF